MRKFWLFAVVLLWSCVGRAAEMNGHAILKESAAAYRALKSYQGSTAVIAVIEMGEKKLAQTASAQIQFSRSAVSLEGLDTKRFLKGELKLKPKIRIDGLDTLGRKFAIVGDGKRAWQSKALAKEGAWEAAESVEMAVAAETGIAINAPTLVPAALFNFNWGYPFTDIEKAALEGRERVDNTDCYRVVSETPLSKRTFWVDGQNFLLRQMREERGEDHMANLMSRMPKLSKEEQEILDAKMAGSGKIKSMMVLHVFAISAVDKPMDETAFNDPTQVQLQLATP